MILRILVATLALLSLAELAHAEIEKNLVFRSPNRRWQVTARWDSGHLGYLFDLRDRRSRKTYFRQATVSDNEPLPYRFSVSWSPGSRYAAVNLYYGRITERAAIIDVSGRKPQMHTSCSSDPLESSDFLVVANHWRNATDLDVDANLPLFLPHPPGSNTHYSLVVRFAGHESTVIRKTGGHD
jgi:hypothetical protein